MGRFRGGLTTKTHALVDADGRPLRIQLAISLACDAPMALSLLDAVLPGATVNAYETDGIRIFVTSRGD